MRLATIIQGGMGAGVSTWELDRTVCCADQLGVVSGTGVEAILAGRLQTGDPGGHARRTLAAFPEPGIAERIVEAYFAESLIDRTPARRRRLSDLGC